MPTKLTFLYQSLSGATFNVNPALVSEIEALVSKVRAEISTQQAVRRFIGYLSVPVSSKSGGDFQTNTEIAAHITKRITDEFGPQLWILNPAAYNLPKTASGGDYMAVWSDALAGEDGLGNDFDMAYFVGPSDVWEFFGAGKHDRLGVIEKWLADRASSDLAYKAIFDDIERRQKFLRYYGLRGSSIFSKGSHDEWNILVALNAKRASGEDIAIYFDGKPIEPGDYQNDIELGYQTLLH